MVRGGHRARFGLGAGRRAAGRWHAGARSLSLPHGEAPCSCRDGRAAFSWWQVGARRALGHAAGGGGAMHGPGRRPPGRESTRRAPNVGAPARAMHVPGICLISLLHPTSPPSSRPCIGAMHGPGRRGWGQRGGWHGDFHGAKCTRVWRARRADPCSQGRGVTVQRDKEKARSNADSDAETRLCGPQALGGVGGGHGQS